MAQEIEHYWVCAFCFLLASRLQNESARVFLPVLFSSFPSQCVLSLSPFFLDDFLFVLFSGWLCLQPVSSES